MHRLQAEPRLTARLNKALGQINAADAGAEQATIKAVLNSEKGPLKGTVDSEIKPKSEVLAQLEGVRISRAASGTLIISGEAVTEALAQDLVDWLAAR